MFRRQTVHECRPYPLAIGHRKVQTAILSVPVWWTDVLLRCPGCERLSSIELKGNWTLAQCRGVPDPVIEQAGLIAMRKRPTSNVEIVLTPDDKREAEVTRSLVDQMNLHSHQHGNGLFDDCGRDGCVTARRQADLPR